MKTVRVPSPPARRQRLRGAHLRNRVVSAAATGDWLLGCVAGPPVSGVHDWIVCGQCGVAARRVATRASAESLCRVGAGDWRLRRARIARRSICRAALRGGGHAGCAGPGVARDGRRRLPVASDVADGRVAAGAGPLAGNDSQGRLMGRVAVQRQYRRRRFRLRAGRILSPESPRHGRRHLRGGCHQPPCCAGQCCTVASRVVRAFGRRRGVDRARLAGKRATFIYIAIALSGLSALGAQVVWTRLLSLLLGGTVYTFSIILAVFLVGLWAGSSAGSFAARRISSPAMALTVCQLLLVVAIGWTARTLASSLPYWPVDPWLALDPLFNFQLDLVRCLWAMLPATLLWGASFPLALAAAAEPGEDPGKLSGEIYAANTAGSVAGALAFSLVLIPEWGTRASQQLLDRRRRPRRDRCCDPSHPRARVALHGNRRCWLRRSCWRSRLDRSSSTFPGK